uniref:FAD-dependent oxidoreductase n=1 Tax=Lactobacillus delbrueckii TaxID=1584 RepID=UPI0030C86A2E
MSKYLVVGAGLFGAVFAREAAKRGHEVTVIEKRDHIAGNIYTKEIDGIQVHQYGAHIFHTSNKEVWEYVQQFAEFNRYTNSPVANYKGKMYNLPFNMNTFTQMWGVRTPQEAIDKINEQRAEMAGKTPQNLEEQAISLIGRGNAVINYTDAETPYTRVIEHKHFEFGKGDPDKTIITREYPADWHKGDEPYYPVNNDRNNDLYAQYKEMADKEDAKVIFGGRLGQYKYYNMDQVIAAALEAVNEEFGK